VHLCVMATRWKNVQSCRTAEGEPTGIRYRDATKLIPSKSFGSDLGVPIEAQFTLPGHISAPMVKLDFTA
ncbi:MAG TPA: hypothetical protein PK156_47880, partial [Polyangium sp.]|nr:hypothetical protein [Polyangium sp.]